MKFGLVSSSQARESMSERNLPPKEICKLVYENQESIAVPSTGTRLHQLI
jgi:hypothetical protein